jgi:hypothetical protein
MGADAGSQAPGNVVRTFRSCGTGMAREFYNWIDTAIKFTSNVDGRKGAPFT